jgi:colicin import membrane protein
MTPEERAKHDAKIAERKAKKEAMTPEEKLADAMKKAAAKAAREKKAAVKAAELPMRAASPPKEKAE